MADSARRSEGIQCGGNSATFVRYAREPKSHLNSAEGSGEREVVEASQVADAKYFAGDFRKTRAQGHVEMFEDCLSQSVGIVACGHQYGS